MPNLDLNFAKVGMIPGAGTFRLEIKRAVLSPAAKGDSHNILLVGSFLDMPEGMEDFEGVDSLHNLNTHPTMMQNLQKHLEAITQEPWRDDNMTAKLLTSDEIEEYEEKGKTTISKLTDCTVIVSGVPGEYEGQKQWQWKKVYADDAEAPEIGLASVEE